MLEVHTEFWKTRFAIYSYLREPRRLLLTSIFKKYRELRRILHSLILGENSQHFAAGS